MHEGISAYVYRDTAGHATIGIGFNLDRHDAESICKKLGLNYHKLRSGEEFLSEDGINRLYEYTVKEAEEEVKKFVPGFDKLSDVRKRVLIDLMFNLGGLKFSKFVNFISYVNRGRFDKAALQLLRSRWMQQAGYRGIRLTAMMLTDIDLIP